MSWFAFSLSGLDFVGVVPVAVAKGPPSVLDAEHHPPVALYLLEMFALVAQQRLVVLVAWQDVDGVPEAGPAVEFAGAHVCGDQACGGADFHAAIAPNDFHVPGAPAATHTHPKIPPAVGAEFQTMSLTKQF